jgi:hypothetical protein
MFVHFAISFNLIHCKQLGIELSTILRLSGGFELGVLVNAEKTNSSISVEANHMQIKFISTPTFSLDSNFQTFLKQFLGT